MENKDSSESSRIYALFYSFFLIPLMMVVFGVLFYLLFNVLTDEPTDINQLLNKLETGSMRDKANASYRINKLFDDYPEKYSPDFRQRIIRIHKMSKAEFTIDKTLRLHVIMIMGNSKDTTYGQYLIEELNANDYDSRIKAIESLGKIRYKPSAKLLKKFLGKNNSFHEKLSATGSLGNIGNISVIPDLVKLVNSWPSDWNDADGPELRWEATMALLKLGYSDEKTIDIISNLLDRSYYSGYEKLDSNQTKFLLLKILHILYSIENTELLYPFKNSIFDLSNNDTSLEIRNFSKKLYKKIQ
tara:strand:+ start:9433 stop:10335 length:903 start_codon:yes stop_codon:yes gene_type:complete